MASTTPGVTIESLSLAGARRIVWPRHGDDRGWFQRVLCEATLNEAGLVSHYTQQSLSWSEESATLRGMHLQAAPHGETKLITCIAGRVFDVLVDLRATSATFGQWTGLELSADEPVSVYIPSGFAHGFITLVPGSCLLYAMDRPYYPEAAVGFRYDDASVGIDWPLSPVVMSADDQSLGTFEAAAKRAAHAVDG